MKTPRFIQEIKAVGLVNWHWWVFVLKRNEFSNYLSIGAYWDPEVPRSVWMTELLAARKKAHEIELILAELPK